MVIIIQQTQRLGALHCTVYGGRTTKTTENPWESGKHHRKTMVNHGFPTVFFVFPMEKSHRNVTSPAFPLRFPRCQGSWRRSCSLGAWRPGAAQRWPMGG